MTADARCPDAFLDFATSLPALSRPIVLRHFRTPLEVDDKADSSPVTRADRDAEAALRQAIAHTFPEHGVLGEEYGADRADADHVWVIDPIDGTRAYVSGIPLFGTLVALCRHGVPVLGLVDLPALHETWLGAVGHPTRLNGRPVRTRHCPDLGQAVMCATTPEMFEAPDTRAAFERVRGRLKYFRFGTECCGYALVSAGWADFCCESLLQPYDYLAHVPLVAGAGGVMTGWDGAPLTLGCGADRVLASGDPEHHHAVLALLSG